MSIETEIVDRLEADAGVGAIAGDRIYPNELPQDPLHAERWQPVRSASTSGSVHTPGNTLRQAIWMLWLPPACYDIGSTKTTNVRYGKFARLS